MLVLLMGIVIDSESPAIGGVDKFLDGLYVPPRHTVAENNAMISACPGIWTSCLTTEAGCPHSGRLRKSLKTKSERATEGSARGTAQRS